MDSATHRLRYDRLGILTRPLPAAPACRCCGAVHAQPVAAAPMCGELLVYMRATGCRSTLSVAVPS